MLTVTETASARLAEKLVKKQADDDEALRFVRKPRGWKLHLDTPTSDDVLFTREGRTVLVLGVEVARLLVDHTLDTKDSPTGSRLCLR